MAENQQPNRGSQASHKSTPYSDQHWEVVGERADNEHFELSQYEVVARTALAVDPMFADYGGRLGEGAGAKVVVGTLSESESKSVISEPPPGSVLMREEELERLLQQRFEAGREEAAKESEEQLQQHHQQIETGLTTILEDLRRQLDEHCTQVEKNAVQLALDISRKVIGQAVEINPEYLLAVIKEGLSLAKGASVKKIRVSPEDMEFIRVVGFGKEAGQLKGDWVFEGDPSIKAGCVIETSAGEIDFQLDKAWERIRESVVKAIP